MWFWKSLPIYWRIDEKLLNQSREKSCEDSAQNLYNCLFSCPFYFLSLINAMVLILLRYVVCTNIVIGLSSFCNHKKTTNVSPGYDQWWGLRNSINSVFIYLLLEIIVMKRQYYSIIITNICLLLIIIYLYVKVIQAWGKCWKCWFFFIMTRKNYDLVPVCCVGRKNLYNDH